jgi:hypothetical protein
MLRNLWILRMPSTEAIQMEGSLDSWFWATQMAPRTKLDNKVYVSHLRAFDGDGPAEGV